MFDSGVGGLTVLAALRRRLPRESFLYLGDTARLPYGTKTGDTVMRYALQAAGHLAGRGVKALVIACNTASAHAMPALRVRFPGMPVIGMVEPGAEAAAALSPFGRIAVLSTESTAKAGVYKAAIARLRPEAEVRPVACSLFVALAEEGWLGGDIPLLVARRYLGPLFSDPVAAPDTLVLGCTHFPLLRAAIEDASPHGTRIVDGGESAALHLEAALKAGGLLAVEGDPVRLRLLATDGPERFARLAGHFLGSPIAAGEVELVDLAAPLPA